MLLQNASVKIFFKNWLKFSEDIDNKSGTFLGTQFSQCRR